MSENGHMLTIPTVTLNDGTAFPELGLGTYNLRGPEGVASVVAAIEAGYRLLDTAVNYENEREVGEAVRTSGMDRGELLVTTKIPGRHHGYDEAVAEHERLAARSRSRLPRPARSSTGRIRVSTSTSTRGGP